MSSSRLLVFSASQVETFMACPRKWAWKSIAGIKPPQAASAQVGDAGHKELETHLGGGQIDFMRVVQGVRIGDVIAPGIGLLPAPGTPGMQIESTFRFPSRRGPWAWTGRKDLTCASTADFPGLLESLQDEVEGPVQTCPVVSDHKTTGNMSYAKTSKGLVWDVQAGLYAYEELSRWLVGVDEVDLVWTYYQTKGAKKAKRVHLRMHRDHAVESFARIEALAAQMAKAHTDAQGVEDKHTFVRTLRPNVDHCRAFGGCPYESECQLTIEERFKAQMSGDFFSNLEGVAAAEDAAKGVVAQPPAINAPQNVMGCADTQVPAPQPGVSPFAGSSAGPLAATTSYGPINPPESALPGVPVPPAATQATQAAPTTPTEAKGPGRPRLTDEEKAARKAAREAAKTTEAAPEQGGGIAGLAAAMVPTAPQGMTKTPPAARGSGLLSLFVDCLPDGMAVTYADDLVRRANEKIVEQTKATGEPIAHYKFLTFGKAAGALDIALQQVLAEAKPDLVFCSSSSDALPTLTRAASVITRSVR